MIVAVSDTGPLIHLDEVDALSILSVVDELLVPQTVYEVVEPETAELTVELDPGETAALAIASERSAVLLTDDLAARDAAEELDIEVHGSIGIIVLAYSRGELTRSEAVDLMRALQTGTSLFVTDAIVEHGIGLLDKLS